LKKSESVHSILRNFEIRPKKKLGQHFLHATPTIKKIVASLAITRGDTVVEIGPGPGVMTPFISDAAKSVIAIDADADMIEILKSRMSDRKNVKIVYSDILKVKLPYLIENKKRVKIIGNLPYNISSQIVFWMIDSRKNISKAVIMVQKEVAQRLAAKPGGKEYGILSVILQAFARCSKLFDVSPNNFLPPPKVTSSILMIEFSDPEDKIGSEEVFIKTVKAAFGKRRKTIRNSLLESKDQLFSAVKIDSALTNLGIDPKRRAETLSVKEFIALSNLLTQ